MKNRKSKNFFCLHCQRKVFNNKIIGTHHRNHCPFCLWSKHLDLRNPGDRLSKCQGKMKPVGLTFKLEGWDKYTHQPRQGELMLIHWCQKCQKISINRIAGDDDPQAILKVFRDSLKISPQLKEIIKKEKIRLLTAKDKREVNRQLFGTIPPIDNEKSF